MTKAARTLGMPSANGTRSVPATGNPMNATKLYPCGRISRRRLLHQTAGGFLGAALGALWSQAGEIPDATLAGPHFAPRAKSVIFLFMCGGVSHIDTFDPK